MIDKDILYDLQLLDNQLQRLIDKLIPLRQSSPDKQLYSYVSKKADMAGKAVGMALDKINYKNVDFKLDREKEGV